MAVGIALWILPTLGFTSLPVLYLVAAGLHFTYSMACGLCSHVCDRHG